MAKRTHAEWITLFTQQHTSGLSAAAFCRQHKLCPKYFSLRKKQLRWASPQGRIDRREVTSAFVPARVTQPTTQSIQLRWQSMDGVGSADKPATAIVGSADEGAGSMIQWQGTSVYLHREPVDFRKAINGLPLIVEQTMSLSPFESALFVFCNKRRDQLKVLYWDHTGFCLWQKRLEKDKFKWPRKHSDAIVELTFCAT